jgi:DNA-binding protein HU-beta
MDDASSGHTPPFQIRRNPEKEGKFMSTNAKSGLEDLARKTSKKAGVSQKTASDFISSLFDEVGSALEKEDRISLPRFGIFKKKHEEERQAYNPGKGKKVKVKAHNRVTFSPSKAFADGVNRKYRGRTPNVLDEMVNLVGMGQGTKAKTGRAPSALRKKAIKRAKITLAALTTLALLFLAVVIFVPAYFTKTDHRAVAFVRELNSMMGLENLSERISAGTRETINVESLGRYIGKTGSLLSKNRKVQTTHSVRSGDTIYSIAKRHYGNKHYWPYLYYQNRKSFEDPDLIRPGERLLIYESPGNPKNLTEEQKRDLAEAFITMYRVQRVLGEGEIDAGQKRKGQERIRESRWTLYGALRYDHDLLDTYEDAIYPEDADIVDDYIDRFGFGDGNERNFFQKLF